MVLFWIDGLRVRSGRVVLYFFGFLDWRVGAMLAEVGAVM